MADYYATTRSNYFGVKDEKAFLAWAESTELGVQRREDPDHGNLFMIYSDQEKGAWPNYVYNEEKDDFDEVEVIPELAKHLKDGHVAILLEIGSEKLRYLVGVASAVNCRGEQVYVDLDAIYKKAGKLGDVVTRAEY
ncbi:hypothetical protein H5P28_04605 [Ruficoccus amylovorans]|uniref:Uncharacterized protein n=1 Tax=Ruficoccus amylovorans TaxID=1804625 RepID=A0A842HD70_9BACT|nr:hypothetical protein [Ruficoccus amylovorans]MBC2593537.1 hypothetical protein [Ruficoccus amylovorans]